MQKIIEESLTFICFIRSQVRSNFNVMKNKNSYDFIIKYQSLAKWKMLPFLEFCRWKILCSCVNFKLNMSASFCSFSCQKSWCFNQQDGTVSFSLFIYCARAIKRGGFYSKNIFWTYALQCIWPKFIHAHIVKTNKIHFNAPISGCFKGCGYNSGATFNGADTVFIFD